MDHHNRTRESVYHGIGALDAEAQVPECGKGTFTSPTKTARWDGGDKGSWEATTPATLTRSVTALRPALPSSPPLPHSLGEKSCTSLLTQREATDSSSLKWRVGLRGVASRGVGRVRAAGMGGEACSFRVPGLATELLLELLEHHLPPLHRPNAEVAALACGLLEDLHKRVLGREGGCLGARCRHHKNLLSIAHVKHFHVFW